MESQYLELRVISPADKDLLIALLNEAGFEGFEEQEDQLICYGPVSEELKTRAASICRQMNVACKMHIIPHQNWNEIWESNFPPVTVPGFCEVRAPFHPENKNVPYEIVIMPKMSFGTGHHATTFMMMEMMSHMDLDTKQVFDFGTGTGVLAILAAKLGATDITAIDTDEWSFENAKENATANHITADILQGSIEEIAGRQFEIILANINRHILLEYMQQMKNALTTNGFLLLSGILEEDEEVIRNAAKEQGLSFIKRSERNGWLALLFQKTGA